MIVLLVGCRFQSCPTLNHNHLHPHITYTFQLIASGQKAFLRTVRCLWCNVGSAFSVFSYEFLGRVNRVRSLCESYKRVTLHLFWWIFIIFEFEMQMSAWFAKIPSNDFNCTFFSFTNKKFFVFVVVWIELLSIELFSINFGYKSSDSLRIKVESNAYGLSIDHVIEFDVNLKDKILWEFVTRWKKYLDNNNRYSIKSNNTCHACTMKQWNTAHCTLTHTKIPRSPRFARWNCYWLL